MKQTEAELKKLSVLPSRQRCSQKDPERRLLVLVLTGQRNREKESVAKKKSMSPNKRSKEQGLLRALQVVWEVQTLGVGERCLPPSGEK